jgi:hypothetical protein
MQLQASAVAGDKPTNTSVMAAARIVLNNMGMISIEGGSCSSSLRVRQTQSKFDATTGPPRAAPDAHPDKNNKSLE